MVAQVEHIDFGNYRLLRKLAHGGMAEIFLGRRHDEDPSAPPVVIKCILPELMRDRRFLALFINEAQLAAQMDHHNLVKVLDFGEVDGRVYMVMEWIDGLDCWRFYRRMFPWGERHVELAIFVIREMLAGLHYAHRLVDVNGHPLGVVHRDLSPSNIYLSREGAVKLGDFGIARILSTRYRPIEVIPRGKFGYMAPEQVEGREVDARADVFSAGVVLTEIMIGQRLYTGSSQLSVMLDIRDGRLDNLERNAELIPPALLAVLRRALALDPRSRWSSAAEFSAALGECQGEATPDAAALGAHVELAMNVTDTRSSVDGRRFASKTPVTADEEPSFRYSSTGPIIAEWPTGRTGVASLAGTPVTAEPGLHGDDRCYLVMLDDDTMVGPTSYAHLVELIYSDRVGPETRVSVGGRDFLPAQEFPDLARHLPAFTPTEDLAEVAIPDRRGFFEAEPPGEVVLALALKGDSGLLVAQLGESRKEVYLRGGSPVYVGSNDPRELLGEFMVRGGRLERMELEMALALLPKFNGHFGDTLVALGMVTAVDLFAAIRDQVAARLEGLLGWRGGNYEFYRSVAVRQGVIEIPIDPYAFVRDRLLAAASKVDPAAVLAEMSGSLVGPRAVTATLAARMSLAPERARLVTGLDGWRTLGDLLAGHDGGGERPIVEAAYLAIESGMWAFDGPAPVWR